MGVTGDPPPDKAGLNFSAVPLGLTAREIEILRLIADDLSNWEIARDLTISVNTVQSHVSHLLGKLGFRSRHQAADLYRQLASNQSACGHADDTKHRPNH